MAEEADITSPGSRRLRRIRECSPGLEVESGWAARRGVALSDVSRGPGGRARPYEDVRRGLGVGDDLTLAGRGPALRSQTARRVVHTC
jgi:hypothetical protein